MKLKLTVLLVTLLSMTSASEANVSVAKPQPRLRLDQSAQGTAVRIEPVTAPSAQPVPTTMDKVVVVGSKLPSTPKSEAPDPIRFSPLRGGPIFEGKIGPFPLSVGMWPWREILTDDIPFHHQKTRADFDVIRIRL